MLWQSICRRRYPGSRAGTSTIFTVASVTGSRQLSRHCRHYLKRGEEILPLSSSGSSVMSESPVVAGASDPPAAPGAAGAPAAPGAAGAPAAPGAAGAPAAVSRGIDQLIAPVQRIARTFAESLVRGEYSRRQKPAFTLTRMLRAVPGANDVAPDYLLLPAFRAAAATVVTVLSQTPAIQPASYSADAEALTGSDVQY